MYWLKDCLSFPVKFMYSDFFESLVSLFFLLENLDSPLNIFYFRKCINFSMIELQKGSIAGLFHPWHPKGSWCPCIWNASSGNLSNAKAMASLHEGILSLCSFRFTSTPQNTSSLNRLWLHWDMYFSIIGRSFWAISRKADTLRKEKPPLPTL